MMSEQNNSAWPFTELEDDDLDISKIFGDGADGDSDPFETPPSPEPQLDTRSEDAPLSRTQPIEPTSETQPAAPELEKPAPEPAAESPVQAVPVPETSAEQQPDAAQPAPENEPDDLLAAAMAQHEQKTAKTAAKSLFEKLPVFSYGSVKEEITDPSMTFEELRIAKSDDFPELGEGKRVSWTVEYGKTSKAITDPKASIIHTIKAEIERSEAFLTSLKKAKDKSPDCLVKPRVTAQSKGIASYKGVFSSLEEARASDKPICLIPSKDGNVYELRKTELGEFLAPKDNVTEFPMLRAGFNPALPRVPMNLLEQIISFFRHYMNGSEQFEALAHILWDKAEKRFIVRIPAQKVSRAHIDANLSDDGLLEERYLHYIDIHSHNSMDAKFSPIDDHDERATRIYIVLGHLDRFFPDISVRMSCGGVFQELPPDCVLEGLGCMFPKTWRNQVEAERRRPSLHPVQDDFGVSMS